MVTFGDYELKAKRAFNDPDNPNYQLAPATQPENSILYAGIDAYQQTHDELVKKYKHDYDIKDDQPITETYFRDAFYAFLTQNDNKLPHIDDNGELMKQIGNFEAATITMEDFFGKQYTELYQRALAEEANSKQYMDALLHASSELSAGPEWQVRPIIIGAGPSGCGKSFAAEYSLLEIDPYLPKDNNKACGNKVIYIDGGKCRKLSQVRNLAVKAANNKGFTGIEDLHDKSNVLEKTKKRLYDYATQKEITAGVVIPETFSFFLLPKDKSKAMLKKLSTLPHTFIVFTKVVGSSADPLAFADVVAFMGSSRALKKDFSKLFDLRKLNEETDSESKKYGPGGFLPGVLGSNAAETWFNENCQGLNLVIINDLMVKEEFPPNSKIWEDALSDARDPILVSSRIFAKWLQTDRSINLDVYRKLPENKLPPKIRTLGQISVATAKVEIQNEIKKFKTNNEEQKIIVPVLEHIIDDISPNKLKNEDSVNLVIDKLGKYIEAVTKFYESFPNSKNQKSVMQSLTTLQIKLNIVKDEYHLKYQLSQYQLLQTLQTPTSTREILGSLTLVESDSDKLYQIMYASLKQIEDNIAITLNRYHELKQKVEAGTYTKLDIEEAGQCRERVLSMFHQNAETIKAWKGSGRMANFNTQQLDNIQTLPSLKDCRKIYETFADDVAFWEKADSIIFNLKEQATLFKQSATEQIKEKGNQLKEKAGNFKDSITRFLKS